MEPAWLKLLAVVAESALVLAQTQLVSHFVVFPKIALLPHVSLVVLPQVEPVPGLAQNLKLADLLVQVFPHD
jgi:hypothetical protein